jgi:hypothetical protein
MPLALCQALNTFHSLPKRRFRLRWYALSALPYVFEASNLPSFKILTVIKLQIHSVLRDWNTGAHAQTDFQGEHAVDVYRGHELFANKVLLHNTAGYHRAMADIFEKVL